MMDHVVNFSSGFSLKVYLQGVSGLLMHPRRFFRELSATEAAGHPLSFLMVSAIVHSVAGLLQTSPSGYLTVFGIRLANALGMTLLMAAIGYALMLALGGRRATFARFFSVYAHASGMALLISWMPALLMPGEIWKWSLVGIGLTTGLGFKKSRALAVLLMSIGVTILLFYGVLRLTGGLSAPSAMMSAS